MCLHLFKFMFFVFQECLFSSKFWDFSWLHILFFAFITEGFSFLMSSDWFVYEYYWFVYYGFPMVSLLFFFRHIIIYYENSNFSCQILMLLIAFSCLMIWANTFNTILNYSRDSGRFYLVPDLVGDTLMFIK